MRTVYKYPFGILDHQIINLPVMFQPVHVGTDPQGQPCLWAIVNTDIVPTPHTLYVRGTGHPVPEDFRYMVGSFIQDQFVWHVFIG